MNQFSYHVNAPVTCEKTEQDRSTHIQHLSISPKPDWDNFMDFVAEYIADIGADIVSQDYGMDRHQVGYELNDERFLLHYEHYSQSVWVESIN